MVKLRAFITGLYYGVYITYTIIYFWQIYKAKKLMQARAIQMREMGASPLEDVDIARRDYAYPGEGNKP